MNISQMIVVAGKHLIANPIADTNKTIDLHKVTGPNNHTGPKKLQTELPE